MKNILFITYTNSNGGGAESLLTSYVNYIDSSTYRITILEIEHFDVKKEPLNPEIKFKALPVCFNNSRKHLFFYYFSRINRELLLSKPELIRSLFNLRQFDYVITWNYQLPSFLLTAFPDAYRIGFFHGSIDDLIENDENRIKYPDLQDKIRNQFKAWNIADKIITISNNSFESLKKCFPMFIEKCEIINNGININRVQENSRKETSFTPDPKYKYICCCGRIDEYKNFQLAVRALSVLSRKIDNVKLIIIGMGDKYKELLNLVQELGLSDRVIFTGYQQNPHPILSICDVFCLTSFCEGFPMVVMEAMALGKPFVTTKVSGASDEMSDNNTCGLVAEWDENDFADKIYTLLSDNKVYNKMKENCLEKIKKFTLEASINRFYKIFDAAEEKKNNYKKICNFRNKFSYFIYASFHFNKEWFSKKWKTGTLKALLYLAVYCLSILLIPLKFIYVLIYILIAGV